MTTPKNFPRRTRAPRCPTPGNPDSETKPAKAYIGGYVDGELASRLQTAADAEARGNKTLMMEKFLREGLAAYEAARKAA